MADRFVVGRILKTHGVRGELKVTSVAGLPGRYKPGMAVRAAWPDGRTRDLVIRTARAAGDLALVAFEGFPTPEEAAMLRGAELTVPQDQALPVRTGGVRFGDVVGFTVRHVSDDRPLGTVRAVVTAVQDLLEVDAGRDEPVLVPWVPPLVPRVDAGSRTLWVDPPGGLFDDDAITVDSAE
ncbi:MAG: 16S rRNA processing protein RimM [Candidatus Sericytochromatia bacterium]|nr:16S rRNA processing protein RimM [Candidatus Tanganyikabacteria bacterium]